MNDLVELFVENNNILLKMMRMHADECSSSLSLWSGDERDWSGA
jgi:hypothetical protein